MSHRIPGIQSQSGPNSSATKRRLTFSLAIARDLVGNGRDATDRKTLQLAVGLA